ncbi:tetratricopeptide repeat protein [Planktothrix agardhii 1032]|jgi:tetratricopeptide (TPR) repeat protein|uniref:tetratricopeptide repeat protein n=1 Tax=Planktothrix agardhii TaxID=1160 RepID=UPI001D0ADA97|nr:tetratricopeptide repeat protein [Planktothrix agardhii]MCB8776696.1 tetratricopeptide repeat protein [Planktothrix agardhii 1031]MCF3599796.1 tetratricopeptide repeat protein [Planktothrix agardhii 1032]MCP9296002.1 tetratricopeptide repeat protein [Planktothrix agardhii LY1]
MQPDTSTTYLKQGQQLQREGRLTEAEVAYRQAMEINPIFYGSFRYLGEVLAVQGKLDQAVEAYQRAKELNPKALWVHQRLGEVFLQLNKIDDAIACFQTVIEINPDFSWAYNGLGECWSLKENRENAIAAYQKAVELNPDSETFRHKLEKVLAEQELVSEEEITEKVEDSLEIEKTPIEQKTIEEVIADWRRNGELNSQADNNSLLNSLEPISTILISPEQLAIRSGQLVEKGTRKQLISPEGNQGLVSFGPYIHVPDGLYLINIDWELLESLENYLENEIPQIVFNFDIVSEAAIVVWHASTVNIEQKKLEFFVEIIGVDNLEVRFFANGIGFAVNFIQFTLLYQPTPSDYLNLGRSLQLKGRINPAITAYKKSFSPTQKFNSLKELGDFLTRTGYQEEASIVYYKIANSNDSNLAEKISACESALEIKPQWLEMTSKLSELYENLGQLEDAIQNYQKQLETSPDWIEGYLKLAEIYEKIGQIDLAIHSYQRILEIEWDYPEVYARIGRLERQQGKYKREISREPFPDQQLKLTVVIPTYNRSTRLKHSLENNLKTDRSDIEFLIIDNNSTDNTAEVVQNFMGNDQRIRYINNVANLGTARNMFLGLVSCKAPLAMILADDDYVTEGFVDLVIWIFDTHPTVGGVFNCSQEDIKKSMFSTNPRGGCLYKKGLEGINSAMWAVALCGSAFRQSFVNYHAFKLDASIIPQQWFSLDLVMRHDVYGVFSETEYSRINAYLSITTTDGQTGGNNMLYRVQNGFMPWDVGAYERINFHLYRLAKLGLKELVGRYVDGWIFAHFRIWLGDGDPEGASILISRVIRNPYIRYSIVFWNSLINIAFSKEVALPMPNKLCLVLLGCFMLIWRLILKLRECTDSGLADIYYVGAWPRKDTPELKHSKLDWEAEGSADIGYSATTVIFDLECELG